MNLEPNRHEHQKERRTESRNERRSEKTDEQARLRRFADAIDAIGARAQARVGDEDVRHVEKMRRASRALEAAGRVLIHVSPEPVTFFAGVGALFLHKQLETGEIGHTALHGAFDGLPAAAAFHADRFRWRTPIDEESWRVGHNVRHHQYTNIAGRDPDIHFGPVRLTKHTPHRPFHYVQVPWLLLEASTFMFGMNLHFTGVIDAMSGNGRPEEFDFLPARTKETVRGAWQRALRKFVPYYAREYGLFPLLAGPLFGKVLLGNWMSEVLRDLYTAATIYCGHVGDDVATYDEGTRAHGRGQWYAMQVAASNNYEVPHALSILCGALDKQIEHHLFPKLPTNRLREIAPEVRRACLAHGVAYKTASWPRTLGKVLRRLVALSFPDGGLRAFGRKRMPIASAARSDLGAARAA